MNKYLLQRTKVDLGTSPELIPIAENNEPLVELKACNEFDVRPIWELRPYSMEGQMYRHYIRKNPGYGMYLRAGAAQKLTVAAASLPTNWRLIVVAGHRPIIVQQMLYDQCYKQLRGKFPNLSKERAAAKTRLYVADPSRKAPSHCCGAAVDVDVLDTSTHKLVDFGARINAVSRKSHIHDAGISDQARRNRLALVKAMIESGFSSLHSEWWHYSYGDQNWAAFYREPYAIYGTKDINV